LSTFAAIGFGALGGLLGWLVLFAFPELKAMWAQQDIAPPGLGKMIIAAAICGVYVVIGACAAPIFSAGEAKEAILYGVAGEGLFAGLVKTTTS
jgi:hypothetical protein